MTELDIQHLLSIRETKRAELPVTNLSDCKTNLQHGLPVVNSIDEI